MLTDTTSALLPVYATFPLRAASGHGSWLVDEEGHEWLDAYGGHAVATCGHSHPDVVAAIAAQASRLLFYSTAVPHANRELLADALIALLSPLRDRLDDFRRDPAELDRLLAAGAARARELAAPTLAEAYRAVGLTP